jgi:hypothetical protein
MGDGPRSDARFKPGDQVRVDTGYGDSFYGTYLQWRPQNVWQHLVKVVAFRVPSMTTGRGHHRRHRRVGVVRLGDEVRCTDKEIEACAFVAKPPTSIQDIEQFLEEGVPDRP